MSRLGAHVDPILGLFAPLWWIWPSPAILLVVQAIVVSSAAIPAYLLARRWLDDELLAVAFAAVTLLFPAIQWATALRLPRRDPRRATPPVVHLGRGRGTLRHPRSDAALAAMTKEQVGLSLVILGIWMAVSLGRRWAGAILAAGIARLDGDRGSG